MEFIFLVNHFHLGQAGYKCQCYDIMGRQIITPGFLANQNVRHISHRKKKCFALLLILLVCETKIQIFAD